MSSMFLWCVSVIVVYNYRSVQSVVAVCNNNCSNLKGKKLILIKIYTEKILMPVQQLFANKKFRLNILLKSNFQFNIFFVWKIAMNKNRSTTCKNYWFQTNFKQYYFNWTHSYVSVFPLSIYFLNSEFTREYLLSLV